MADQSQIAILLTPLLQNKKETFCMSEKYDLIVVGAGPGGEVGAIRAAQLGLKVALVEKYKHLGGTCLNYGCIPTKALLESAKVYDKLSHIEDHGISIGKAEYDWTRIQERKQTIMDQQRKGLRFLMKKNKIDSFEGHGRLISKTSLEVELTDGSTETLTAKNILLATGSRVRHLPFAKVNGKTIHNSDTVLSIKDVPKTMLIIGGGVVGMEFASCFGRFGCQVTVVEMSEQVLPFEDKEVVKEFTKHIKKQNVKIKTASKLEGLEDLGKNVRATIAGEKMDFDTVLVSIGRAPVVEDIGLDKAGVELEKGFIGVDEHYKTNVSTIYAIGDIIATPALAHTASAEAIHAVEQIAGHNPPVINYAANPSAVYTYPEVASIGKNEEQLKKDEIKYQSAKFPFAPMAKAKIEGATQGFIKILFEPEYKEILGVHIVGARATELIAEFSLAKILESTVDDIGHTIHPHPTISETIMEVAHTAMGGAIHM